MTKVTVVEVRGCMASSAAITHDVMATANRISGAAKRTLPFRVTTVRCGPNRSNATLRGADLIIVPGLGTPTTDELNAKLRSAACQRLCDRLVDAFEAGAMLATPCASTFLLAEAGLLNGRRATTTWWFAPLAVRVFAGPSFAFDVERLELAGHVFSIVESVLRTHGQKLRFARRLRVTSRY